MRLQTQVSRRRSTLGYAYSALTGRGPREVQRGPPVFWLVRGSSGARYEKPQTASSSLRYRSSGLLTSRRDSPRASSLRKSRISTATPLSG
jgi:hypothetical protein